MGGKIQLLSDSVAAQIAALAEERYQIQLDNELMDRAEERFDRAEKRLDAAEAAGKLDLDEEMMEYTEAAIELAALIGWGATLPENAS
jgi:hypothetical protein